MYQLTVSSDFSAAHFLRGYSGQCQYLHGHTFYYEVVLSGDKLDELGMLIDFKDVKEYLKSSVEKQFDHASLNEVHPFISLMNPTAENLARVIYETTQSWISNTLDKDINVDKVTVKESPECSATYSG